MHDGYLGSGKRLKASIKKYGEQCFTREVLATFNSREELECAERELITEEFLSHPRCLNLRLGGDGGFDHTHRIPEIRKKRIAGIRRNWCENHTSRAKRIRAGIQAAWHDRHETLLTAIQIKNAKMWGDPGFRRRKSESSARSITRPEHSKKVVEAARAANSGTRIVHLPGGKPFRVKKDQVDNYLAAGHRLGFPKNG